MNRPTLLTAVGCAALALAVGAPLRAQPAKPFAGPAPTDRSAASLYGAYCANCHGATARGDGPLARRLATRVPDLRRGMRLSSGADGVPFLVQDVVAVLNRGVPEAPMPPYAGLLSPPELQAVAKHVARLAAVDESAAPLDLGVAPEPTPDNVVEGGILFTRGGCVLCHGLTGRGPPDPVVPTRNLDGSPVRFPDLTQPVTWRGGGSARELATRIARGMPGTPMPAYRPALKDREIWQLALYVETLEKVTSLTELAKTWASQPPSGDPRARGEHILRTSACTQCHRVEAPAREDLDRRLLTVDVGPLGVFTAGSFSLATGPGAKARLVEDLRGALVEGRGMDGRRLMPAVHPWPHLQEVPAADLDALADALANLPRQPVAAPPPQAAPWLDQLWGKIAVAARLTLLEARFGAPRLAEAGPEPRWMALAAMGGALLLTLFLSVLALGGPKRSRGRRMLGSLLPLPAGAALALLMVWPPYRFLPDPMIAASMSAELPQPVGLPDEATTRLAQRGRALVAQVPCAACHTAYNPFRLSGSSPALGGGTRLRSKAFGRVYAGNLTPDPTGLGGWTAEEIRRAIRGGVGRDGRVFHWDAMPYDHFGLFTDVELEAIVTYLRALPPVAHRVPAAEAWDDSEGVVRGLVDSGW